MGTWETLRNKVGLLALGASLLLASPGVQVVRAEADPAPPAARDAEAAARDADVAAFPESLRCEQAKPGRTAGARLDGTSILLPKRTDQDHIVLNTRGYNYGPRQGAGPAPAPARVDPPRR
jgi:hypothetical protein